MAGLETSPSLAPSSCLHERLCMNCDTILRIIVAAVSANSRKYAEHSAETQLEKHWKEVGLAAQAECYVCSSLLLASESVQFQEELNYSSIDTCRKIYQIVPYENSSATVWFALVLHQRDASYNLRLWVH